MPETKYENLKAVPSSTLAMLKKELSTGKVGKIVSMLGHKWKIEIPDEDARTWALQFVRMMSPLAMSESLMAPELAVSIVEIDGVPITEHFTPPEGTDSKALEHMERTPREKLVWARAQLLMWINETLPEKVIRDLHGELQKLRDERTEALKAIPNS